MLITPQTELGKRVKVVDVLTREVIPTNTCDTEEGWLEMYLLRPGHLPDGGKKVFIDRKAQELAKIRLHAEFDVVDRESGEVLYAVRWTMSRPPRVFLAK